jgi:hypothetical protein
MDAKALRFLSSDTPRGVSNCAPEWARSPIQITIKERRQNMHARGWGRGGKERVRGVQQAWDYIRREFMLLYKHNNEKHVMKKEKKKKKMITLWRRYWVPTLSLRPRACACVFGGVCGLQQTRPLSLRAPAAPRRGPPAPRLSLRPAGLC